MKFDTGRKTALGFYTAAVVAALLRGIIHWGDTMNAVLLYGMFALAIIGFVISYSVCRCRSCGRVIGAKFRLDTECPYCRAKIDPESKRGK